MPITSLKSPSTITCFALPTVCILWNKTEKWANPHMWEARISECLACIYLNKINGLTVNMNEKVESLNLYRFMAIEEARSAYKNPVIQPIAH